MEMLKDLFSPEEFKQYQVAVYPFNLFILDGALKARLLEDPGYEVFAPLTYCKFEELTKSKGQPLVITPYEYYISNKGSVVSLRGKEPAPIGTSLNRRGYVRFNVSEGHNQIKLLLHRAVACSFIPPSNGHPKEFHVNHLSGIKTDCGAINLEWCTNLENMAHATDTGLMHSGATHYAVKPVKGTVLKGAFKDHQFLLIGSKEIVTRGFDKAAISKCCLGQVESHFNCAFAFATEQEMELPQGIPDEIFSSLIELGKGVKSAILATHIETGESQIIEGGKSKLIFLGFEASSVYKVINGKLKSHKGYTFERIIDAA